MILPTRIDEFNWLDERVHAITARYKDSFGSAPLNISHWDPSEEVRKALAPLVNAPPSDVINYFYSYTLHPEEVARRLGFALDPNQYCLLTPGGTASMLSVAKLVHIIGINVLHITCPFYFPLRYQCEAFGLRTEYAYLERQSSGFSLPADIEKSVASNDAVWITNPVYCTGSYCSLNDMNRLESILDSGCMVIADESLALRGHELAKRLGQHPGFIGIYSPHKTVSVNSMKFSAIVTRKRYERLLESWADILYGALTASTVAAVKHFLSEDFTSFEDAFIDLVDSVYCFLRHEVEKHSCIELDEAARGHYVTCYVPGLPASLGENTEFLWRTAVETGAIFIAGTRNHFDPRWGLSFRVNLTLDSKQFRAAIIRLLRFLSEERSAFSSC